MLLELPPETFDLLFQCRRLRVRVHPRARRALAWMEKRLLRRPIHRVHATRESTVRAPVEAANFGSCAAKCFQHARDFVHIGELMHALRPAP